MGDSFVRIERFDNGFTVEIKDPAIVKANAKRDTSGTSKGYTPYKDPWKTFVFKTDAEVIAFLNKNLKKAIADARTMGDYEGSFDLACTDGD